MSDHHCWSNVSSVTNITNKENVIVFYDILSCPCPIIMKQLSNPRPTVAPPPHMVSSKRAGPQCRQFSHDNWINYPRSDNPAPASSQAPPHMNEHRQTQRHLWDILVGSACEPRQVWTPSDMVRRQPFRLRRIPGGPEIPLGLVHVCQLNNSKKYHKVCHLSLLLLSSPRYLYILQTIWRSRPLIATISVYITT